MSALAAVLALAAFGLAACGSSGGSGATASLTGSQWVLNSAALGIPGGDTVTSWIHFDAGAVTGNDGCNQFNGGYKVDGSAITIGPLGGTRRLCPDPQNAVATKVLASLAQIVKYDISGARLQLKDAAGAVLLTYNATTATLEGSWTATSVLYDDAIRGVVTGTELTAVFGEDGNAAGSGGCNTFTGKFTTKGEDVTIGPLAATRKACVTPAGADRQEVGYFAALESAKTFQQIEGQLTLFDAQGRMAVIFTRAG
jgi:heat shock protein HslJ